MLSAFSPSFITQIPPDEVPDIAHYHGTLPCSVGMYRTPSGFDIVAAWLADMWYVATADVSHDTEAADLFTHVNWLLQCLRNAGMVTPEKSPVSDYIMRYPGVENALLTAATAIKTHFGTEVECLLQVNADPEIDNEYLVIYLRSATYDQHFMEMLDEVQDAVTKQLSLQTGYVLISTDFASPSR